MSFLSFKSRTPRWIVVVADLTIAAMALGIAYLLRFDMMADQRNGQQRVESIIKVNLAIFPCEIYCFLST